MKNGKKQQMTKKNQKHLNNMAIPKKTEQSVENKAQTIEYGKEYYQDVENNNQ